MSDYDAQIFYLALCAVLFNNLALRSLLLKLALIGTYGLLFINLGASRDNPLALVLSVTLPIPWFRLLWAVCGPDERYVGFSLEMKDGCWPPPSSFVVKLFVNAMCWCWWFARPPFSSDTLTPRDSWIRDRVSRLTRAFNLLRALCLSLRFMFNLIAHRSKTRLVY